MAHYAFLDKNNIVTEVIIGIDETETIEGLHPETWYGNFRGQVCKRTSYNGNIRFNFASVGYKYDLEWDAFVAPKPYSTWKLNYETFLWEPPVPMPEPISGFDWRWSEDNHQWIKFRSLIVE
jgi:hypothetical protein